MESQFLYSGDEERNHCHGANILQSQSGDLFACWYSYPDQEHVDGHIMLSKKVSGSQEWAKATSVFLDYNSSLGNPVLFEDTNGTLVLIFVILKGYWDTGSIYISQSSDAGLSWSIPAPAGTPEGVLPRHQPVSINNHYLAPFYHESEKTSSLWESSAPYTHWNHHSTLPGQEIIQPGLLIDDEQRLFAFFRPTGDVMKIHLSQSTDLGKTWAKPEPTSLVTALSGYSAFRHQGYMYVIFNHTKEHKRTPLSLSRSNNQGQSWSAPWNIDESDLELSYPSFISGADGYIHGLYTYNRRMIKYVKLSEKDFT